MNESKNRFGHVGGGGDHADFARAKRKEKKKNNRHIFNSTRAIRATAISSHYPYRRCDSNNIEFKSHEIATLTQMGFSIMCQIEITAHNDTLRNFPFDRLQTITTNFDTYAERMRLKRQQLNVPANASGMHQQSIGMFLELI